MARSESNQVGNTIYPDLSMTSYPARFDSRNEADTGYNPNMKGAENAVDYNLAEHINALSDAVMALQRSIGLDPTYNYFCRTYDDIDTRLYPVERRNYDRRYGGVNWNTTQTLVGHTHTSTTGSPPKINLEKEVQGQLNKENINLNSATINALTAEDIRLDRNWFYTLVHAINHKYSLSDGGPLQGPLTLSNAHQTRTSLEFDSRVATGGYMLNDESSARKQVVRATSTSSEPTSLVSYQSPLLYGRYTIGLRIRYSDPAILFFQMVGTVTVESVTASGKRVMIGQLPILSSDFGTGEQWKTFHLVVNHEAVEGEASELLISLQKTGSTSTASFLDFDCGFVELAHPAVYDI